MRFREIIDLDFKREGFSIDNLENLLAGASITVAHILCSSGSPGKAFRSVDGFIDVQPISKSVHALRGSATWTAQESAMPSSHSSLTSNSEPHALKREAKRLRKLLQAGDFSAIQRARAVFQDLEGVPDVEVATRMPLMRCQHVIAKEHGATNWSEQKRAWEFRLHSSSWKDHMSSGHYRVFPKRDHEVFIALMAIPEKGSASAIVQRMMSDMASFSWEFSAYATRQECREFFAWAFRSLTKEDASIGTDGVIDLHRGAFRIVPLSSEEYSQVMQQLDDYAGNDWMPESDD